MYAVIKTGGKQYRVAPDDVLTVEKVAGDAGPRSNSPKCCMIGGGATSRSARRSVSGAKVVGRAGRADPRPEGDLLQEAPPQELAPQARSPPGPLHGPHHEHRRRLRRQPRSEIKELTSMAQKKAGGSTKNGRDFHSKRLGIKRYGGEHVIPGNILVPPAWHAVASGHGRRHRHRPHHLRRRRGRGRVQDQAQRPHLHLGSREEAAAAEVAPAA